MSPARVRRWPAHGWNVDYSALCDACVASTASAWNVMCGDRGVGRAVGCLRVRPLWSVSSVAGPGVLATCVVG
jgi:hypothetical protein